MKIVFRHLVVLNYSLSGLSWIRIHCLRVRYCIEIWSVVDASSELPVLISLKLYM